jgi:hypothetical protein
MSRSDDQEFMNMLSNALADDNMEILNEHVWKRPLVDYRWNPDEELDAE